jgi:hypothetical protein
MLINENELNSNHKSIIFSNIYADIGTLDMCVHVSVDFFWSCQTKNWPNSLLANWSLLENKVY